MLFTLQDFVVLDMTKSFHHLLKLATDSTTESRTDPYPNHIKTRTLEKSMPSLILKEINAETSQEKALSFSILLHYLRKFTWAATIMQNIGVFFKILLSSCTRTILLYSQISFAPNSDKSHNCYGCYRGLCCSM